MGNGVKPCRQHTSFLYEPLINPTSLENKDLRVFSVTELKKATKNFRKDRVVTGEDGWVRTFYKGYIDNITSAPSRTKTRIDVSVMECHQQYSLKALQVPWKISKEEVESLGQISHPNLVKLLGYCCEDNKPLLVYEYFHKGSLDHHIFGKEEVLTWETRVKIAIGLAQGIVFLYSIKNSPIYHELEMHNIMLDEQNNAKLFYLESKKRFVKDERIYFGRKYMPFEYIETGFLRMETDVFAFGVILLELFTGSRGGKKLQKYLRSRTRSFLIGEIVDPRLGNDYPVNAVTKMGTLIQSCTKEDWKKRPLMQHVLDALNYIVEIKD